MLSNVHPASLKLQCIEEVESGLSRRAVAKIHHLPKSVVGDWVTKALASPEYVEQLKASVAEEGLNKSSVALLKEIDTLHKHLDASKDIEKLLIDVIDGVLPKVVRDRNTRGTIDINVHGDEEIAMLDLSDMQIGQKITPDEIVGLNEYNEEVFNRRLDLLIEKVLLLTSHRRKAVPVKTLVINFIGDIVEGESIFDGQPHQIDLDAFAQFVVGSDRLTEMVRIFASHFDRVLCYCVKGNHGRIGKKGQHSERTNLDRVVYHLIQKQTADLPNVSVEISAGSLLVYKDPLGWVHSLVHGDQVRGNLGIPYYGIDRAEMRLSKLTTPANFFHIGHHHSAAIIPNVSNTRIVNGSFVGTSNFSANQLLVGDIPRQWFYFLHETVGITNLHDIHLAEPVEMGFNQNGVLYGGYVE